MMGYTRSRLDCEGTHLFIAIGDGLADRHVVLKGSKPERRDTGETGVVRNLGDLGLLVLVILNVTV